MTMTVACFCGAKLGAAEFVNHAREAHPDGPPDSPEIEGEAEQVWTGLLVPNPPTGLPPEEREAAERRARADVLREYVRLLAEETAMSPVEAGTNFSLAVRAWEKGDGQRLTSRGQDFHPEQLNAFGQIAYLFARSRREARKSESPGSDREVAWPTDDEGHRIDVEDESARADSPRFEARRIFRRLLQSSDLSDVERRAVVARERDDLEYAEIADRENASEAAVRKRYSRGMKKLRATAEDLR